MIVKVNSKSKNTEVDSLAVQIITSCEGASPTTDPYIPGMIEELKMLSGKMTLAIKKIKSESELDELDELRDDAVRSCYYMSLGSTHHPNSSIREAAIKIMNIFDNYELKITNESYTTESSLIHSLLLDLNKPEIAESITKLPGLTECIAALKVTQDNFETNRRTFEQGKAEEGTYLNATLIKGQILKLINGKLITYIKVMADMNTVTYGELARILNQMISRNNETVKKRSKKQFQEVE